MPETVCSLKATEDSVYALRQVNPQSRCRTSSRQSNFKRIALFQLFSTIVKGIRSYRASRYGIEIEETGNDDQDIATESHRESAQRCHLQLDAVLLPARIGSRS